MIKGQSGSVVVVDPCGTDSAPIQHHNKHTQAAAELEQAPGRAWRWWREQCSRASSPSSSSSSPVSPHAPWKTQSRSPTMLVPSSTRRPPQEPVLFLQPCRRQPPVPRAVRRWLADDEAERGRLALAVAEASPSSSHQQGGAGGVDQMVCKV